MGLTRKTAQGRSLAALTTTLVRRFLVALLLAGAALATPRPGKPTAKAPPRAPSSPPNRFFAWSKARRGASTRSRVYKGSKLLVKRRRRQALVEEQQGAAQGRRSHLEGPRQERGGNGAWSTAPTFKGRHPKPSAMPTAAARSLTYCKAETLHNAYAQHGLIACDVSTRA